MIPTAAPPRVRSASPFDVPAIAALQAACFADRRGGEVWSGAAIARILALPGAYGLLATLGADAPAGFLLGRTGADKSEVLSLGVPRALRRRGVGRALVRAAIERAGADGSARLVLEVAEDNWAALGLYAGAGFVLVGRQPRYYRRRGVAALVFARDVA